MFGIINKKSGSINDVFQSRAAFQVDNYTNRKYYEDKFSNALKTPKCILIRGNSGSGKSWLTHFMALENEIECKTINLANAMRYSSLDEFFKHSIPREQTQYQEEKNAGVSCAFADGGISTAMNYDIHHDYYKDFLNSYKNGGLLIFENFESIIDNPNLIRELGGLITLVDDPDIQKYNVKIIIIATNTDTQFFFSNLPNADTIDSRITELPEIRGFSPSECMKHVLKGFDKIGFTIDNKPDFCNYIYRLTNGFPLNVNDLCRNIVEVYIDDNTYCIKYDKDNTNNLLITAQKRWLDTSFSRYYSQISNLFNENIKNNVNRNNYILFMISENDKVEFSHTELHADITTYFPSLEIGKIVVKNYLNKLSNTEDNNNILINKGDGFYSIRNFKSVLCMRTMLYLKENMVYKYDLNDL